MINHKNLWKVEYELRFLWYQVNRGTFKGWRYFDKEDAEKKMEQLQKGELT